MELINGKPTIEQLNTVNVKGQVTCYKCGNTGHYARDCLVNTTTKKDYIDPNNPGKPVISTTTVKRSSSNNSSKGNSSSNYSNRGDRSSGRDSDTASQHSRNSNRSRSSGSSKSSSRSNVRQGRKQKTYKKKSDSGSESEFVQKSKVNFMNKIKDSQRRKTSKNPTKRPSTPRYSEDESDKMNMISELTSQQQQPDNPQDIRNYVGYKFLHTYQNYALKKTVSTNSPMEMEDEAVISAMELVNHHQDDIKKFLTFPPTTTTTLIDEELKEVESEEIENFVPSEIVESCTDASCRKLREQFVVFREPSFRAEIAKTPR